MKTVEEKTVRTFEQQADEIYDSIEWLTVAEELMDVSFTWLDDRMRGQTDEGVPVAFTPEEKERLLSTLDSLADRIHRVVAQIRAEG